MKKHKPTFAYIGSDGGIEVYNDPYYAVTAEDVIAAQMFEDKISETWSDLTLNFVKLGYYLDEFQRKQYYRARGYPSFTSWLHSPEIDISRTQANKLIRIKREVIPLLMDQLNVDEQEATEIAVKAGVSKLGKILAIISLGYENEAVTLTQEAPSLTFADVALKVRALKMGKEMEIDESFPAMFRATIRKGETFSRIRVDMLNGVTVENCGYLTIRNIFLQRFIDRFGELVRFEGEE